MALEVAMRSMQFVLHWLHSYRLAAIHIDYFAFHRLERLLFTRWCHHHINTSFAHISSCYFIFAHSRWLDMNCSWWSDRLIFCSSHLHGLWLWVVLRSLSLLSISVSVCVRQSARVRPDMKNSTVRAKIDCSKNFYHYIMHEPETKQNYNMPDRSAVRRDTLNIDTIVAC